ncbi:MAG: PDZ domain-containing protein [Planctomycetes bacterium]|nr:PDZ domain-containing protein [Planctomycetota bacterium]
MNRCNKHPIQQVSCPWSSMLLVAAAILFTTSSLNAQQRRGITLPQPSIEELKPFSGLPTQEEILSTKVDEKIKQIVDQLDSPAFTRREEAAKQLVSENISRRQICKILSGNDLSLEQRHRLVDWLRNDLITTPHAAIGIGVRRTRNEIIIDNLIENLPATEVLEYGDQIIGLDGLPINQWTQFYQSISSRKPGDKVTLTIKRSFEPDEKDDSGELEVRELDFDIILGSDEFLLNRDGTKQVNSFVKGALAIDMKTIVNRYGPKIVHIQSEETSQSDFETTQLKINKQ